MYGQENGQYFRLFIILHLISFFLIPFINELITKLSFPYFALVLCCKVLRGLLTERYLKMCLRILVSLEVLDQPVNTQIDQDG